ncbi:MAG: 23S rRNA (uracil(1939)-C(5))-methyltransferase RlmD [Flavobacteriaceae bacterium]|nr:23S rRNA (uracil(1939)-C(5))-methyltransferase RlmD [Flavobacteriaceae bacterium]|tara:strand:+ start:963 stop:2369 length:1407 start_codon:yes stop_codon:yes gene_type:complete
MSKLNSNKILENCEVVDIADKGKSVAKSKSGETVFLENAVPGDIVDVIVKRKKKGTFFGKILKFNVKSKQRIKPVCEHFGICGGCIWQNMNYNSQLYYKERRVHENLFRIGKIKPKKILPILASKKTYYYRNKMEYSFSNTRWLSESEINSKKKIEREALGLHKKGRWDRIVDIKKCHLQEDISNTIRNEIKRFAIENKIDFFDPYKNKGLLRNLIIKITSTKNIMVLIQFGFQSDFIHKVLNFLKNSFENINSILYVINLKSNDSIYDQDINLFHGKDYIIEKICGLSFKISAKTFFQTNSAQAEKLFYLVKKFLEPNKNDILYDLYTGIGTIGQILSKDVKKVIGIDIVEDSINYATENSKLNNLSNTKYFVGEMKKVFTTEFIKENGNPSVAIVNPPREGIDKKVIEKIIDIEPKKIVYVSCNSSTLARDLVIFQKKYEISRLQTVDMFPHTSHVENVVLLKKNN